MQRGRHDLVQGCETGNRQAAPNAVSNVRERANRPAAWRTPASKRPAEAQADHRQQTQQEELECRVAFAAGVVGVGVRLPRRRSWYGGLWPVPVGVDGALVRRRHPLPRVPYSTVLQHCNSNERSSLPALLRTQRPVLPRARRRARVRPGGASHPARARPAVRCLTSDDVTAPMHFWGSVDLGLPTNRPVFSEGRKNGRIAAERPLVALTIRRLMPNGFVR